MGGGRSGVGVREAAIGDSITNRHKPPPQAREPSVVQAVLATGKLTVDERVGQLQGLRGRLIAKEDRAAAVSFLAGKELPEGMGKGSTHWLSDELLTALRLQEPPWEGLAAALIEVAFQAQTDPVVRDYIMQHLGHLWEQYGARKEIEQALWRAVEPG